FDPGFHSSVSRTMHGVRRRKPNYNNLTIRVLREGPLKVIRIRNKFQSSARMQLPPASIDDLSADEFILAVRAKLPSAVLVNTGTICPSSHNICRPGSRGTSD